MSKMDMVAKIKESMETKLEAVNAELAKVEADLEQVNALATELEAEDKAHAAAVEQAREEGRQQGITEAGTGDMVEALKPLNEKIALLESEKLASDEDHAAQVASLTAQVEDLSARITELESAANEEVIQARILEAVNATKREIAQKIKDAQVDDMALASELEA